MAGLALGVLAPGAAPAVAGPATGPIAINEVESTGDTPDFIELTNTGATTVDISGYVLRDDSDAADHALPVPAGTTLAPGAFVAFDTDPPFGLGSSDSARLFAADGTTLLDSYTWTEHATTSYGRCPDGTGEFATTASPTRGAANDCAPAPLPPVRADAQPWPGSPDVTVVDDDGVLGEDQSGLFYEPSGTTASGVLWTVQNDPGRLWRLLWNGTVWAPDTANGWGEGKQLHYPDGTGTPDSEGVTLFDADSAGGIFVSTERNGDDDDVSKPAILRFDPTDPGTELTATAGWDLTADLPTVGANLGLEALTWYPDDALVDGRLVDTATGAAYDPATYGAHFGGLLLAGLEADGDVYGYALDEAGTGFTRVTTFSSGFPAVMELQYDPDAGALHAVCDNTCEGQSTLLRQTAGSFSVVAAYARPVGLPDVNNEGFALAPDALCVDGLKPAIWADDDGTDGHALRQGTLACDTDTVPPTTGPTTGPGGGGPILAATGAEVPGTAGLALALLAAGTALTVAAGVRRRHGRHRV